MLAVWVPEALDGGLEKEAGESIVREEKCPGLTDSNGGISKQSQMRPIRRLGPAGVQAERPKRLAQLPKIWDLSEFGTWKLVKTPVPVGVPRD